MKSIWRIGEDAVLPTRMLMQRFGLRTRLRQSLPNPTAVRSLGEHGHRAPGALRRSAYFISYSSFPIITNASQVSQISSANEGPGYHPN